MWPPSCRRADARAERAFLRVVSTFSWNTASVTSDLTNLLENPAQVEQLPPETIPPLLVALSTLQGALAARLLRVAVRQEGQPGSPGGEPKLLSVPEAAALLGVPAGYAYELARRGEIPTVRFGKYVRVSASALREWVARRQEKGRDTTVSSAYSSQRTRRNAGQRA